MKSFYKENRFLIQFIGFALALFTGWKLLDNYTFLTSYGTQYVIENLVKSSKFLLELFGFDITIGVSVPYLPYYDLIRIGDSGGVQVGDPCSGVDIFALFAGFVMAFPGSWRAKLWYIPSGVAIIHLLNVLRVMALIFIQFKWPDYLDFNHKYTFTAIMYGVVFLLLVLWVQYFASPKTNEKEI